MEQAKQQLEMVRTAGNLPSVGPLPPGYVMRQYRESDRASYWRLFREVFNLPSKLEDLRSASVANGFHVIESEASGDVVASAVAAEYVRAGHAEPGSLQWVMADPLHAGKGIGKAAVAAATTTLSNSGYKRAYLSTDDWRLPAIHVYLEQGWQPHIYAPDMESRWLDVYKQLRRTPGQDEFVVAPFSLGRSPAP